MSDEIESTEVAEIVKEAESNTPQAEAIPEKESAEESVRQALKEVAAGADKEGSTEETSLEPSGEQKPEFPVKQTRARSQDGKFQPTKPEQEELFDVDVPQRLDAREKKIFSKLPPEIKSATNKMFKNFQAQFTRGQQELSKQTNEAKHIIEAVRPYYVSHPEFAENGILESHIVSALIAAHQKLTDKKTDKQTLAALAKDRGYNIQFVDESGNLQEDATSNISDIESHPKFQALQNKLNRLDSQMTDQQTAQIAAPIVSQFEAIRDERDSTGNYRFPMMHQSEFWTQAKPLVSALTNSGLSHGEALKRAYSALHGPVSLSQPNQTGLPVNNQQSRAVTGASSVRGRIAPQATQSQSTEEIPAKETPEQSARAAWENLRRGIN